MNYGKMKPGNLELKAINLQFPQNKSCFMTKRQKYLHRYDGHFYFLCLP